MSSKTSALPMSVSFLTSMYLYLAEGSVIILTNGILVYSILGKKKNRERREFLLIVSQAFADTSYAVAFMLIAVHRLGLAARRQEDGVSTVWECALKPALPLHNYATPLLGILPLTTSINFLVCSVFPLWYLRAGWTYTIVLLSCPQLVTLFLSFLNYVLLWEDHSPTTAQCVAAKGAAHHLAYGAMLSLRMLANLASALIYSAIILYLRKGQRLQELSAHQRKTHRNAAITLGFVTLNSMALLFIPDVLLFFNPVNINKDYSTLLYSLTLSKSCLNFVIFVWRYGELYEMIASATCRRVPRLRKYFPERSAGFRSSQVGDTSAGRMSVIRRSSFISADSRKAIHLTSRRGTSVSPKQLGIPKIPQPPRKEPVPREVVREKSQEEKEAPTPKELEVVKEEVEEPVAIVFSTAEVEQSVKNVPEEAPKAETEFFLPPIALFSRKKAKKELILGFDNRSIWSNK